MAKGKDSRQLVLGRLMPVLLGLLLLINASNARPAQTPDFVETNHHDEDQDDADELQSFLPVQRNSEENGEEEQQENRSQEDLCATIFCGNGRECVLENGNAVCACARACPEQRHLVCGSDGITYGNPCELHRAACLQNIRIHKHMQGPCEAPPPTLEPPPESEEKPLVCYEIERDQLRQLLIDWMKGRVENELEDLDGSSISYARVLTENFRACDLDKDDQLNSQEFMECVEKNETVADFTGHHPEDGHVLRGLCVDALILMSDTNEDWLLDLEEFLRCMDPNFEPPRKQCSLENQLYEDGAETRVDCNICVCACGNWVCSAMSCKEIEDYNLFSPYDVEQGPLPSREERYALLRGFIAAEHVNLDMVEDEVPPHEPGDHALPQPQSGHHQTGHHQTGHHQTGHHQTGHHQTDHHQAGHHQEGHHQEGHHQEGHHQEGHHHQFQDQFPYEGALEAAQYGAQEEDVDDVASDLAPAVAMEDDSDDLWPYLEEEEAESEEDVEEDAQEDSSRSNTTPREEEGEPGGLKAFDEYIQGVHKAHNHQDRLPTEDEVRSMACCSQHGKEGHVHHHNQENHDNGEESEQPAEVSVEEEEEETEDEDQEEAELALPEQEEKVPTQPTQPTTTTTTLADDLGDSQESEEGFDLPRRIIPVVSFNITVAEHRVIHTSDPQAGAERQEDPHTQNENGNHHNHHNNHINHHHKHNHHKNHHHQGQGHEIEAPRQEEQLSS